ncbi:MAG: DUF3050 domain-containing protein [Gammaproteobacteria bacterium]
MNNKSLILLQQLEQTIAPLVHQISEHAAFQAITSIKNLRIFSEIHVFAVFDFMSLIKALQRQLSCIELPWLPPQNSLGCHLINHLVGEEESDILVDTTAGTERYLSHFDLYLEAMRQCGANLQPITQFITDLRQHKSLLKVLTQNAIPPTAKDFVIDTFQIIDRQTVHMLAASFTFARENITGDMFTPILRNLTRNPTDAQQVSIFITYLQRHIELDNGKHGEQAKLLVASLCGEDPQKWEEATQAAVFSLESRIKLLEGIATAMENGI